MSLYETSPSAFSRGSLLDAVRPEEKEPVEQTNSQQIVVTDGGIEYDINPLELEYDIKNRWRDTSNQISNAMSRVEGSDLWICYYLWKTYSNGYDYSVKGVGRFTVEPVELDCESIAEQIQTEANEWVEDYRDLVEELNTYALELAEVVVEKWAEGVDTTIRHAVYENLLNHDGTFAWTGGDGLYCHEIEMALSQVDIEDIDGISGEIIYRALKDAIARYCPGWRNPHAEYVGWLRFEIESWELRAIELYQKGIFHDQLETAFVQALREEGRDRSETAEILNINYGTVSQHIRNADEQLSRAKWTTENYSLE